MAGEVNRYTPDYAVPPGWVLQERLEALGLSQSELAQRCGCSANLVREIIEGKAPLDPKTAVQFERVVGLDASIWQGIESAYRLHLAGQAGAESGDRAGAFPVEE